MIMLILVLLKIFLKHLIGGINESDKNCDTGIYHLVL